MILCAFFQSLSRIQLVHNSSVTQLTPLSPSGAILIYFSLYLSVPLGSKNVRLYYIGRGVTDKMPIAFVRRFHVAATLFLPGVWLLIRYVCVLWYWYFEAKPHVAWFVLEHVCRYNYIFKESYTATPYLC